MKVRRLLNIVYRRLRYARLKPIRVFCLHHVSDEYNPIVCHECDWISFEDFKGVMASLIDKYSFISLAEAHLKLRRDVFRFKNYAVITFDDGYRSSLNAIHWLENREIPYTLFLNAKYTDEKSISHHIIQRAQTEGFDLEQKEVFKGLYLNLRDLLSLSSSLASFGSHGYEHKDATILSPKEFEEQIVMNCTLLKSFPQWIPFHAYTWGRYSDETTSVLRHLGIIPVLMDGEKNVNNSQCIHRELFH